jgi:hypothetical protein
MKQRNHLELQQFKATENWAPEVMKRRQINEIAGKLQGTAIDDIIEDFNPQENILLKIDALKSTRSLSL